ncbi:MAG: nucleotidyltransferase domain-containing protein [Nanoarchaeota archaeon]|nr:nucleotidyltransferase domain-containing protein [Nanoarchaeota archaeon]MBU4086730.1 nucleotidyltransferase domain-containing protein [Nanoarchaeota archaeon]
MELVSYAADFASFLIQNTKNMEKIKSIILFGSVARGEAGKESDVDIFVDVLNDEKEIEKEVKQIGKKFFSSVKFKSYWKLLNVKNEINVIVGKLENWKLKDSMLGSSIVLYQKYSPILENGKNEVILTWSNIKPNSKRVMLNKKIIGYNHYKRYYKGLLEIYGGRKLGANVILIPTEQLNLFLKEFHKFKIPVKIQRVFEYEE